MDGDSFANGVWVNKMGGGASASTGVSVSTQNGNANGCNATFKYLNGGKSAGVELVNGWPTSGEHTFFHVTRYNGGTRGRIWNGSSNNWLSGHHDKTAGRVHHDRWLEPLVNPGVVVANKEKAAKAAAAEFQELQKRHAAWLTKQEKEKKGKKEKKKRNVGIVDNGLN
jgi:hypothetical protein